MESELLECEDFCKKSTASMERCKQTQKIVQKIKKLPPLVFSGEIRSLKEQLAQAGRGKAFLITRRQLCRIL